MKNKIDIQSQTLLEQSQRQAILGGPKLLAYVTALIEYGEMFIPSPWQIVASFTILSESASEATYKD